MRNNTFKKIGAYLGLITMSTGLIAFIWGISSRWNDLEAKISKKADRIDMYKVNAKLDKIICYLDNEKCFKER